MRACSKAPCSTLSLAARTGIPPETAAVTYGQSSKVPDRSVAALSMAGLVKGDQQITIAHERTCAPLIFVRETSGSLDGCTVAACTKQELDRTRKTWHCRFLRDALSKVASPDLPYRRAQWTCPQPRFQPVCVSTLATMPPGQHARVRLCACSVRLVLATRASAPSSWWRRN
jgi:hypothetical protein